MGSILLGAFGLCVLFFVTVGVIALRSTRDIKVRRKRW